MLARYQALIIIRVSQPEQENIQESLCSQTEILEVQRNYVRFQYIVHTFITFKYLGSVDFEILADNQREPTREGNCQVVVLTTKASEHAVKVYKISIHT